MEIFANGVATLLFVLLFLGAVVFVLSLIFEGRSDALLIIPAVMLVCSVLGLSYSTTHRVVPANQRWVVINTLKGEVQGGVRKSGITKMPLIRDIHKYPGAQEQPFCIQYTPALKEGYEITVDICGNYDASILDWEQIYKAYNFTGEEQLLAHWVNQSKEVVSLAFVGVDYSKLTTERPQVSNQVRENLNPWFEDWGVSVSNIVLKNWDFTSEQVKLQVDRASSASMQKTIESQLLEAAKLARERQLYEVETANLILKERGLGLKDLISSLGIKDDSAKAQIATQMTWYAYAENPPEGVQIVLSVGSGGSVPVSIPIDFGNITPIPEVPVEGEK